MKAEVAQQIALLELAELMPSCPGLIIGWRTCPEQQRCVMSCTASNAVQADRLSAVAHGAGGHDAQISRLLEIDGVRKREDRDRGLLDSGSVNPKQLGDLQHELATLSGRQASLRIRC